MSNDDTRALTELLAEARNIKSHRLTGEIYSEKCANFVGRVQIFLENAEIDTLSHDQILLLKSIQDIIFSEERFARSSVDIRSPESWRELLNE